jgi:branched-chain amino acid transport system substrate-binding protein
VGATNVGAIGYGIVPSAADYAKGTAVSVRAAGLKAGYLNAQFPLGSTIVGPDVLAMKAARIDGLLMLVQQNTSFAIISSLRQQGVDLKAPLLSAGYGSDLLSAGPAALKESQNVYFGFEYEPIEMNTPATQKFAKALETYGGTTEDPGLSGYLAYVSVDALVTGLKASGPNPTQAQFINAMLGVTHYNAAGLFGNHSMSFAMSARGFGPGADNCQFFTQFRGSTFHLVPGATPLCGSIIPGAKV